MLIDQAHRDRFFQKISRDGDCIVWTGALNAGGYGLCKVDGKCQLAHRVSWAIKHDCWPTGVLRHTCDNPRCVKIGHLRDGTQRDNIDDKVDKDRQHKGEQIRSSKLTAEQVMEIRTLCETRMSLAEVAERYGLNITNIWMIREGRAWRHLPVLRQGRKAYAANRIDVCGELLTVDEIAARAGIGRHAVEARIDKGLTGKDLVARKHQSKRKPYTRV